MVGNDLYVLVSMVTIVISVSTDIVMRPIFSYKYQCCRQNYSYVQVSLWDMIVMEDQLYSACSSSSIDRIPNVAWQKEGGE
jgi:hypothetical protein